MMALVVLTTVILAIFFFINKFVLVSCFFLPTFVLFSQNALSFIITTCPLFGIITTPMKMKKMMEDEETGSGHEEDDDDDDDMPEEDEMMESSERNFKKIRLKLGSGGGGGGGSGGSGDGGLAAQPSCMVDKCEVDLRGCKNYYQRHKVCELHSKAPEVTISGIRQRFCQQCSRFHEVSEFDQAKRSCRARLAGHNERRRKSSSRLVKRPQIAKDSRSTSYKIDWMSP